MAPSFPETRAPSQVLLQSPFSPLFEFELDSKKQSSAKLERCHSEQAMQGVDAGTPQSLVQQIIALCCCTSPAAAQMLQHLQRLRATYSAAVVADGRQFQPAAAVCDSPPSSSLLPGADSGLDIEAMACELLAAGYLIQVRDGAQQQERAKNTRSCLQNLRHRFIVCLGWRSSVDGEPEYLPEPLVVEPRFREQFAIAHPTTQYQELLQVVPPCFVGSVKNLEAMVKLICEQMVISYKMQGLPVPPWRTRQALLSKWSPHALAELAMKIQSVRRLSIDMAASCSAAAGPWHARDRLYNGARPAATHACHAAVGSAPPLEGAAAHSVQAFAATACQAGGVQQLTQDQLMAIVPPGMQQQLFNSTACCLVGGAPTAASQAVQLLPATHSSAALPSGGAAACGSASRASVSISAVAGPYAAAAGLNGAAAHFYGSTADAATPAAGTSGSSAAVVDVLALLEAADSLSGGSGGCSTLKFTRKASAEWKNHRSNGRKIKGLLAAALKKPMGSRGNFAAAGSGTAAAYGSAPVSSAGQQVAAKDVDASLQRQTGGNNGTEALIRRTHYRTGGEEPWRRITTVRWGAYAAQQAAQQAQVASTSAVR